MTTQPGGGDEALSPWSPSFLSTSPVVCNKVSVLASRLLPFWPAWDQGTGVRVWLAASGGVWGG